MATTTVTKGLIGEEDLSLLSSTTTTFSRATSTGGTQTMTKLGRKTLCTREFDVTDYGAVGNGTTDDTAAIQKAVDLAEAAGGGTIVFPAGYTFRVQPTTVNTPIFTLASGNLTFVGYGATIKVDMSSTALQPTTSANEQTYGWVFKAIDYNNLTFLGITYDGNRDDATADPRYGFFLGVKCSDVTIRDCTFQNVNHSIGAIGGNAWDSVAGTGERIENWSVSQNRFEQCMMGIHILEAHKNISITNNDFVNMDIGPYVNSPTDFGPSYTPTYYSGTTSDQRILRSIRTTGFGNTDAATHGEISDVTVSGNRLYGGAWSLELWNGTDKNPDKARRIVVSNNTIWGTHGISVNHFSNVTISGNTITRMVDSDVAGYAGRKWVSNGSSSTGMTVVPFGGGIEAAPNYDQTVSGNTIDGGWVSGTNNGSPDGISVGGTAEAYKPTAHVVGNTIKRCYKGIKILQTENTTIEGNTVTECRQHIITAIESTTGRITASGFTWKGNVLRGNTVIADEVAHGSAATGGALVALDGDWVIDGNTIVGPTGTNASGLALMNIGGFASTYGSAADISNMVITNNVFKRYEAWAISDYNTSARGVRRLHLDGNVFDTEESSPGTTSGALRMNRPGANYNSVITAGRNTAIRHVQPISFGVPTLWVTATAYTAGQVRYYEASGTLYACVTSHTSGTFATDLGNGLWTALTETYDFGTWDSDTVMTKPWMNTSGGATVTGGLPTIRFGKRRIAMSLRTNSGAATVDVASFFPANAMIVGVRGEVSSTITMGGGGTTWSMGLTDIPDAWGGGLALTAGTDINPSSWTVPANLYLTGSSAETLRLTANAGTFTDGYVTLVLDYLPLSEDTI